jgi:drug/metabolite transporter (DMT)-like permease
VPPEPPATKAIIESRWLVPAALLIVYVVWGSTYFGIRLALESLPPFLMAGFRFLVAGAVLFALSRARGEPLPTKVQWVSGLKVGALLPLVGNGGVVFAEQYVASSLAAIIIATVSLWATLFSGLFGKWPDRRQWAGIALGLIGVAVLNLDGELRGSPLAAGVLFFSAAGWAFGSVWSKRLDLPKGAMSSAVQMVCGGLLLLVVALVKGERLVQVPTATSLAALGYLIVFGSLLGFSAYTFLIRRTSAAVATSYAYVNPIVAVLLGVGFGAEKVSPNLLIALVVILAGVALVALPRPTKALQ